jgi:hypothetical protein
MKTILGYIFPCFSMRYEFGGGGGKKGDAPDAPDYAQAARDTAAGNLEATRVATKANRVDQYTPYGNLTYTQGGGAPVFDQAGYDNAMQAYQQQQTGGSAAYQEWLAAKQAQPDLNWGTAPDGGPVTSGPAPNQADFMRTQGDPDRWTSNIALSPVGQQLLDYSNTAQLGLGKQMGQSLGRVDESLSRPFDQNSVQDVADQSYGMQTARLDPQWAQRKQQFDAQMANQGISAGGEAYDNASRDFGQQRNDAYNQARLSSIGTMPQTYQLSSALRSQPLNELNALRTGAQVTNPAFTPIPQQQMTQGPNLLGAAQAQYGGDMAAYNAQVGSQNSMMGGLFGLGSAAIGAYPWGGGGLAGLAV